MRVEVEEVARDQHLPAHAAAVLPGVRGQLGEVRGDRRALVGVVVGEQRRLDLPVAEVVPLGEQPVAVVEGLQVHSGKLGGQRTQALQVGPEPGHAVAAEAGAVLHRPERQLGLVELDAVDAGVDLDPDDRLEVLPPDRVVAVHVEALVVAVRALHPAGVAQVLVDVAGDALLDQVGHRLAGAVGQPAREVGLEGRPQVRVAVRAELAQPEPVAVAHAAQLVQGQDLGLVVVQLDRELPALRLEDDAHHLDAPGLAGGDELGVVDEAVEPGPRLHGPERLLLEVGQGERAAAQRGPDQHGPPVVDQVVHHPQPPWRQARVVAVLAGEPRVEVDATVHGLGQLTFAYVLPAWSWPRASQICQPSFCSTGIIFTEAGK